MKLDTAFIERMRKPMYQTWANIGYDIQACMAECGEKLTNKAAVESCIDANNLQFNGNDAEADQLIMEMAKTIGYTKLLNFLCKHFKLA
jgi:hypothetical protein